MAGKGYSAALRRWRIGLALALLASLAPASAQDTLTLRGGAIYTLNPKQPWVTALVVEQGRIFRSYFCSRSRKNFTIETVERMRFGVCLHP